MKAKEYRETLRSKTLEDLKNEEKELKEQLFRLRFRHATTHIDNPKELSDVRRNIARVKTIIREKELAFARQES